MKKLLFFDIDGTLATWGRPPSEATVRAIRAARRNGHMAFLSTGRPQGLVPAAVKEIGFDGGIYSAGGRVDVGGTVIFDRAMPRELARLAMDAVAEAGVSYTLECGERSFRSEPWIVRRFRKDPNLLPIAMYDGEGVYKISYFTVSSRAGRLLRQRLGGRLNLMPASGVPRALPLIAGEISEHGVSKGEALLRICRYLGAGPDGCIAFGDSMNDSEMLQAAGLGIAMGNADDEVKRIADRVCGSCREDGIAEALACLGLIQDK